jgi:valyl-tRNA synthetase
METGKNPLRETEEKWQQHWANEGIYRYDEKSEKPVYSIDTPPPTVSGSMHLGHAFSYTHQDVIARYMRMKGYSVFYPFGLDDNGLATERLVEKNRRIKARNFTREEFINICAEETASVEVKMKRQFGLLGLSVDWELMYRTIDDYSRKTAQMSFIDICKKERAYRKEAPTMWCPVCETAIAQAELEDKEEQSNFVYITFKVEGGKKITIATTRPELMPACVAIHVHPDDKRYKALVGKKAEIPFFGRKVKIYANKSAKMDFGTGAVYHCTFGDLDDVEWVMEFNLPIIEIVGRDGRFNEKAGKYKGMRSNEARKAIVEDLKKAGHIEKVEPITHVVNVHERCRTPIEIVTSKQWFLKYLDLKDEFLKKGRELNWFPKHMKVRYDNWIKGLKWDWSLSRQRFFGVAFPVWYCKKCGKVMLAGEKQLPVDPLHDKPEGKCRCGSGEFEGEKDVMDTWFTSSLTPQINAGWMKDDGYFKKIFPMSMRPQAHDIITLWAFNTVVKAYLHNNSLPWKDIVISGHALDPKGRKMSKSLGNAIEPEGMINRYSADILRYWASSASLGEDLAFQEKVFVTGKKFTLKLNNAARFVSMATKDFKEGGVYSLRVPDLWLLSRLNVMKKEAEKALDNYEFAKALAEIRNFFWLEFADFYIEEVKYRIYGNEKESRRAAQHTLLSTMIEVVKMIAPFMPHLAEELYLSVFRERAKCKSVHLCRWPESDKAAINAENERKGTHLNSIVASLRKYKSTRNLPLNSTIASVNFVCADSGTAALVKGLEEDVRNIMAVGAVSCSSKPAGKGEKTEINEKIYAEIGV